MSQRYHKIVPSTNKNVNKFFRVSSLCYLFLYSSLPYPLESIEYMVCVDLLSLIGHGYRME